MFTLNPAVIQIQCLRELVLHLKSRASSRARVWTRDWEMGGAMGGARQACLLPTILGLRLRLSLSYNLHDMKGTQEWGPRVMWTYFLAMTM